MRVNTYVSEGLNFIEISNDLDLKVVFCDLGASIFKIYFKGEEMTRNVYDIKDFKLPNCYYGKTIGRTSNRLKGYKFDIHDVIYTLEPNEGYNVLHGGVHALSTKTFKAIVNTYKNFIEVIFKYLSPHLEAGYPGNVNIEVRYMIYQNDNRLDVRYSASSDMDTLFSLTNHSYFTLGDKDISNLELSIKGHNYLSVDKKNLLPKEIKFVDSIMNFFEYKKIIQDVDNDFLKGKMMNGYDSFWYFDNKDVYKVNVSLRNNKYQLDILTDFEGVQIYTSNYKPSFALQGWLDHRDSVAIEPSDSFYKLPVLFKDHLYSREISYIFKTL